MQTQPILSHELLAYGFCTDAEAVAYARKRVADVCKLGEVEAMWQFCQSGGTGIGSGDDSAIAEGY